MTTYRISEVSARTGFRATTLRYYESVGLLDPVRTDAGYRQYDDRSIERLRLVARAKELGVRLDDIVELAQLWDADRCATTASRLGELVASKLDETYERIAALRQFAADLAAVQRDLDGGAAADASCGHGCACLTAGVSRTSEPEAQSHAAPPIACTLDTDAIHARRAEWRRVAALAVDRRDHARGVHLRFGPDPAVAAEVARLSAAEQSCCAFFSFSLGFDHHGIELDVRVPASARPLLDELLPVGRENSSR